MSTEGSHAEQRQTVANVASTLFGTEVQAADVVIGETLRRATPELDFDDPSRDRRASPPGFAKTPAALQRPMRKVPF